MIDLSDPDHRKLLVVLGALGGYLYVGYGSVTRFVSFLAGVFTIVMFLYSSDLELGRSEDSDAVPAESPPESMRPTGDGLPTGDHLEARLREYTTTHLPSVAQRDDTSVPSSSVSAWRRWTSSRDETEGDPPFYRWCDWVPGSGEAVVSSPSVQIVYGLPRLVLRFTPLFVLITALAALSTIPLVLGGQLRPLVGIGLVGSGLLGLVAVRTAFLPRLLRHGLGYALLVVLAGGTLVTIILATIAIESPHPARAVPGEFGLLLFFYLSGNLIYDGVLRVENLLNRLPMVRNSIIQEADPGAYDSFLWQFAYRFDSSLVVSSFIRIRTVTVFAVLFLGPFVVSGLVLGLPVEGSSIGFLIGQSLLLLATVLWDFVLVVMLLQSFLLMRFLGRLFGRHLQETTADKSDQSALTVVYRPGHPDNYAGFHDFGRLAMRVNVIVALWGFYWSYRLYTGGLLSLPPGALEFSTTAVIWGLNYFGPILVYGGAIVGCLYVTIWKLHHVMQTAKAAAINRFLDDDPDAIDDATGQLYLLSPEWPVSSKELVGIILVDLAPLFLVTLLVSL